MINFVFDVDFGSIYICGFVLCYNGIYCLEFVVFKGVIVVDLGRGSVFVVECCLYKVCYV